MHIKNVQIKIIVISIMVLSFSKIIQGQDSKTILGLELAPTVSTLYGNSLSGLYDPTIGYSTGLNIEYFITESISCKSGMLYEKKGSVIIDLIGNADKYQGNQHIDVNFNYIIIPFKLLLRTKNRIRFYTDAGVFFGFLLNQKNIYSSNEIILYQHEHNDDLNNIDLGLSLGLGVNLPMTNRLLLDLGMSEDMGLINVSKSNLPDDGSVKTNSLQFNISIKYKIRDFKSNQSKE